MNSAQVTINLSYDLRQFQRKTDARLAALRSILRALEDGTFWQKSDQQSPDMIFHLQLGDLRSAQEIKVDALRQCFRDMVGSFLDFIDNLIAVSNVASKPHNLNPNLHGDQEILEYFTKLIAEETQIVAQDKSLNSQAKLSQFKGVSSFSREAVEGYITLRNGIEHHKSVMKRDTVFSVVSFRFLADDEEITQLPHILEAGQTLRLRKGAESRIVRQGEDIVFTEQEMIYLTLTLNKLIAPEYQNAIATDKTP